MIGLFKKWGARSPIGQTFAQVFEAWPGVVERFEKVPETLTEFSLTHNQGTRHYEVRITSLSDRADRPAGRLILFRDITVRKQQQEKRLRLVAALQKAKATGEKALCMAETANIQLVSKNKQKVFCRSVPFVKKFGMTRAGGIKSSSISRFVRRRISAIRFARNVRVSIIPM